MDHWSILLAYSAYPVILAALAPRIRFYLHKEFRDGEIRLYLHKEFRAAELGDDASENGDFQIRKQRLEGYKIFRVDAIWQNSDFVRIDPPGNHLIC